MHPPKKQLFTLAVVLIGLGIFYLSLHHSQPVHAGSLAPGSSPGSTFYTLSDIYARLTTGAAATEGGHIFAPGGPAAPTMNTLKEIYKAIPTIAADTIKLGTGYLGVAGTLTPSGGTATATQVLAGKTFFGASQNDWNLQTGAMPKVGGQAIEPGIAGQPIMPGYHDGTGYVRGDANLTANNIRNGANVFGVTGNYPSATYSLPGDTIATDAAATEVCNGDEAWTKAGAIMTGNLNPTAATIKIGKSYCGISGSFLSGMFNGTGEGAAGGTQTNGGIDDYDNGTTAPSDRYYGDWTACNSGNSYCGTGNAAAAYQDNSSGLVWSNHCAGSGATCDPATRTATAYTWANANAACAGISGGGWHLPHQKQALMAYIDGSYGNLVTANANNYNFWTATSRSTGTNQAWIVNLSRGTSAETSKTTTPYYVRCVH